MDTMRKYLILLALCAVFLSLNACETLSNRSAGIIPPDMTLAEYNPESVSIPTVSSLQQAIENCADGDTLYLQTGVYIAIPSEFIEHLCGNCLEARTDVTASTGFRILNKSVTIIGKHRDSTILVTGAGYGVYFENAGHSNLLHLKVTGGIRDLDGAATDAAVVVRGTNLTVRNCSLSDNTDRKDSVVVGIGGLFGREGAEIDISHSAIVNNGWDGIALYKGAAAIISDCEIRKGRGAGIGVTWDAYCVARRNDISEYWKGIGAFGTSVVIAHNNLVHENLGWGIIGTGQSYLEAANNVVYHNGNCGVAPWSQECRGRFVNNIIVNNGWRDEWVCPCVGVWNYGSTDKWEFYNNLVWNNTAGNYKDIKDQTGKNGNISADPLFVGENDFHLQPNSPAIDAGFGEITDTDGSPSDLGMYGGTSALK
ncbi:MAG: right-handed parallel beta-helix repeat-containing protein [Candidatus Zixiibacteriota bacterium]